MSKIVAGHFEADGAIIYLPIGFKPDYFKLMDYNTDTNIIFYEWWGRMEDDQASGKQEGVSITEGVTANLADSGGFAAYDTGSNAPTITEWAGTTAYTARTATADGSLVRPTTDGVDGNGLTADRSAIYECVTGGTSGSSEPTWPSEFGANSASDNGVIWQKVSDQAIRIAGYQGVRIAAALMTDGREYYYLAIQADAVLDQEDVVAWPGGIKGS